MKTKTILSLCETFANECNEHFDFENDTYALRTRLLRHMTNARATHDELFFKYRNAIAIMCDVAQSIIDETRDVEHYDDDECAIVHDALHVYTMRLHAHCARINDCASCRVVVDTYNALNDTNDQSQHNV